MSNNGVQGGQHSAIPIFTGNRGLDALTYADAIDGSIPKFGWTQAQAAQAAAARGGAAVATWLVVEKAAGITYNTWTAADANQTPLKPAFLASFGPVCTTSGAVSASYDLKQRNTQKVRSFMDRVKVVLMLNYNVPKADRNAAFREGYTQLVVAQFMLGISEDLRGKVFGVPNTPATIEAALTAATAAKAEKAPGKMVVGVVKDSNAESQKKDEEGTLVKRTLKKVEDVLAISRRQGTNARAQRFRGQGNRSTNQYSNRKC